MLSHKKKMNSALVYEFLVRSISLSLIEGEAEKASKILEVIKRHFKPGTDLYKEFRLADSLVKTTVSSENVAFSILQEAKKAATSHSAVDLQNEKLSLLKDIKRVLDESVFDQQVDDYKQYATVQTLFNVWRKGFDDEVISEVAQYEDSLVKWLVSPKESKKVEFLNEESKGMNKVLMRVMMKKFKEKYSDVFTQEQSSLIRSHSVTGSKDDVVRRLSSIKETTVKLIDRYIDTYIDNDKYVVEKMDKVKQRLMTENVDEQVDDSVITRFLTYSKLKDELSEPETDSKKELI